MGRMCGGGGSRAGGNGEGGRLCCHISTPVFKPMRILESVPAQKQMQIQGDCEDVRITPAEDLEKNLLYLSVSDEDKDKEGCVPYWLKD